MTEQGIEPRQIFGFGAAGKTNAADVELVIDVLEFAYTRPEITTFVVVRATAASAHSYESFTRFGKYVIIGADSDRASNGLRAVADHFVRLDLTPSALEIADGEALDDERNRRFLPSCRSARRRRITTGWSYSFGTSSLALSRPTNTSRSC